ncbi:MAG: polyketide synthase, partial [Myxococcales bacterium]|nr:polyketide synthase [Myxococcales bacterium]
MSRAIAALRQARLRIEALERDRRVPIAVVGMGCRLPGASDLDAYWSLLRAGGDAIREVPPERWSLAEYYDADPRAPGRAASRHGGFVDGIFDFDRERFGISQAEAEVMDPQQRLLLEVAAEAFERAGDADLAGSRTGVFVGISTHDFALRAIRDEATEKIGVYSGTGSASAIVAGRLAYTFGLRGPCLAMDAACASALVAVHLACQSLRDGDCDRALAAGVNAILSPAVTVYFSRRGVLAPDGVCRAFDAEGDGYARAEGCGALVLRRLDDALRAGDPIVGVIRGSAIGHNGRSNGLTAPSRAAQVDVIRRALADAGVEPGELGYVEAFGAGTRLGDGVELRALAEVLGGRAEPLPIGSVKTNIGHTEAASGVAALIKVLLCLEHGELPPSLHLRRPNPALADAPVRVVQALERWATPRLAGTSAFGFGGT